MQKKVSPEPYWKIKIRERISRLPKSAPFCQKTQHWDTRADTNKRVTAFIVNNNEDHVILVQEMSGNYNLPGGRLKVDEKSEDGIFREICEEVGLELKSKDIEEIKEYPQDVYFIKLIEPNIEKITVSPGGEIDQIIWYPIDDFLKDLQGHKLDFAQSTWRLFSTIKSIINDISREKTISDLETAVINNDFDYIVANIRYYPRHKIEEVIPLAVEHGYLKILEFLMIYGGADTRQLLDIAIEKNHKDVVYYIVDNYRNLDLLNYGLSKAVARNNFVLVHYFVTEGASNIEENIDNRNTSRVMRQFLQNYI